MPVNRDTSFVDTMPQNVAVLFWDRVTESGDNEAFRYPRGEAWESVTWKQTGDRVRSLAAGLLSLGLESEQRVGIASSTRYEWILADLAIMCAGGATTTVYPTHQRLGHGVHPRRLRVPGGLRRGRRAAREAQGEPGGAAPAGEGRHLRRRPPTATG